jgi:hypothetical protein
MPRWITRFNNEQHVEVNPFPVNERIVAGEWICKSLSQVTTFDLENAFASNFVFYRLMRPTDHCVSGHASSAGELVRESAEFLPFDPRLLVKRWGFFWVLDQSTGRTVGD